MLPAKISGRLRLLQWLLPVGIAFMVAAYQIGPARYVHEHMGMWPHFVLEISFYGTTGPIGIWFMLRVIRRWLEQKEEAEAQVYRLNVELQQRVDERTRELREKNEALAAANRQLQELDRLKSELVSLVSHELRSPLTNVRGAMELMEVDCQALNPTCLRMIPIFKEQLSRLNRMVSEVLNVSRIEAGGLKLERQAVDVVRAADRAIDEFGARYASHQFRRPPGARHPRLWGDADRLYEVIANLIDNAVKYSPEGGQVAVSVEVQDHEGIVSVSDRGRGIPPEEQDRIFEKFHRLDMGDSKETYGSGLGLYFCRRVIEMMGGRIWVESALGQGATFRFALPLAEE